MKEVLCSLFLAFFFILASGMAEIAIADIPAPNPVPEPSSMLLVGAGIAVVAIMRKLRK